MRVLAAITAMAVVLVVVSAVSAQPAQPATDTASRPTAPVVVQTGGEEITKATDFDKLSSDEKDYAKRQLTSGQGWAIFGAAVGAGLAVVGGGIGIGRIGGSIMDAIARQPEASGSLFLPMIITAAMIEGGMLFAIVISMLGILNKT